MLGRFRQAVDGPRLLLIALLSAQLIAGLIWLNLDDASPPPWDEAVYLNDGVGYCTNEVAGNPFEYLSTSTFYPPPGVRVQWRLSRNDLAAFWVCLEDVQGKKLVWDQTAAMRLGTSLTFEDLRWSDASIPDGFDLGAAKRLAFSVLEPDPPVHPSLSADVTSIPPQR